MTWRTPITEADLHAYVDGQLTAGRRREVEAYLAEHPREAEQVKRDLEIRQGLRSLFDPVLAEPLPAALQVAPRARLRPALRVAAVFAWLTIGAIGGWALKTATAPSAVVTALPAGTSLDQDLLRPAAFAHQIYSLESRHPVEVGARDEQHLVDWLSKRLRTPLRAPNLAEAGFELIGGRLLPSTNRMAAQFMYQRRDGARVTLYIRRGDWPGDRAVFSYARQDEIGTFYWVDGEMGYALSGGLSRQELLSLSELVHKSLRP
jgi:anti-sigma factor RsiW